MMAVYKYKPVETSLYKRTFKAIKKRGYDITLLEEPITLLAKGETLPAKYKDHKLQGRLADFRECHIKGDWLLIYRIVEDKLILSLHSTGTHASLLE